MKENNETLGQTNSYENEQLPHRWSQCLQKLNFNTRGATNVKTVMT